MKRNINIFDVIKEKLEIEKRYYNSASESDQNIREGIKIAEEIINQVENKFHEEVSIYKYAMLYAENAMKYGVDISEKWETATQNAMALNEAYLRGCQDERDKFDRLREENGWIPCSEKLPKEDDFPEQRYRVLASCSDGIVRNATIKSLLNEELHFSRCNTFTYVAWKPLPEQYKEKQKFSDELLEKVWNEILN